MHIGLIIGTTLGNFLLSGHGFNTYRAAGPNHGVFIAYAILPWTSVMFLGYAFGQVYNKTFNAGKRKKILLRSGLSMLLIFFVFRYFNIYGDPASWSVPKYNYFKHHFIF